MINVSRSVAVAGWIAAFVLCTGSASAGAEQQNDLARFEVELEAGAVWQSKNDVEIPNDGTATRFSLKDLAGDGPWPAGRFYFTWNIAQRHGLRVLAAPLRYTETGAFETPVLFAGEAYAADVPTEATYQFNSWRLTYRYHIKRETRWNWWIGFTAKIRDAKIGLRQGSVASEDTDVGIVPLVYVRGDFRFTDRWHFLLDLDALGGGPGRAEDLSLKLGRDFADRWQLAFGYRVVEGGADVDEVYNFAWFNYAVVSGSYRWGPGYR
jgi:hypothetical protein